MDLNLTPGDFIIVHFTILKSSSAYYVIAVYDDETSSVGRQKRFCYIPLGMYCIYDTPVDNLEDNDFEVTVHRL